jgi:hypothetical protein
VREPQVRKCKKSEKYPRGKQWSGAIEFRGKQKWVGTFASRREWDDAADIVKGELRAAVELERGGGQAPPAVIPTVAEFAGVEVLAGGKVVRRPGVERSWPETHLRDPGPATSPPPTSPGNGGAGST